MLAPSCFPGEAILRPVMALAAMSSPSSCGRGEATLLLGLRVAAPSARRAVRSDVERSGGRSMLDY